VRTQRSEQSNLILQRALQNLHPHARLLLLRSDGKAWSATSADHRRPFENAVKRAAENRLRAGARRPRRRHLPRQYWRRAGGAVELAGMTKDIRKLSGAQLYALDLASRYKLQRSSMGWWAVDHRGMALSDPVEILSPATIRSLWRLLLDGNPDPSIPVNRPSLWANERARKLLAQIARDIDWSEQGWSPTVFH
jgi:hypothetical protein